MIPLRSASCFFSLLLIVFASSASGQDIEDLEAQIAELFGRSCAIPGCHAGPVTQQGLDLTATNFFANLVGVNSKEKPEYMRVEPGNPDDSYLVMKLTADPRITGVQMPVVGDKLPDEEVELVKEWIRNLKEEDIGSQEVDNTEAAYDFLGWKVVNLPTNRRIDEGLFLFLISHRFNPRLSSGYDDFFGLDGSGIIFLNFGYAITDRLFVNLGRSNAKDDVELNAKFSILDEREKKYPLSASVQTSLNWISEANSSESRLRAATLKPSAQLILTKAIRDRGGAAFVPGILFNPDPTTEGESPIVTLGLGGRFKLGGPFSLIGEWTPIISGYERSFLFGNDIRFDSWAGGFEIATAGHVFQIVGSNTVALTTDQYFRGGDLDITKGHFRLGFNIFRVLRF